tara:strand:+ start:987 stop:1166 length:180 start_codon:yes stop_codon:yes gene_type:complete
MNEYIVRYKVLTPDGEKKITAKVMADSVSTAILNVRRQASGRVFSFYAEQINNESGRFG